MLHHECRHIAAHLGAADKKSFQNEDRAGTAALEQVDEVTRKLDRTPVDAPATARISDQ